jgi:hypothetical protein
MQYCRPHWLSCPPERLIAMDWTTRRHTGPFRWNPRSPPKSASSICVVGRSVGIRCERSGNGSATGSIPSTDSGYCRRARWVAGARAPRGGIPSRPAVGTIDDWLELGRGDKEARRWRSHQECSLSGLRERFPHGYGNSISSLRFRHSMLALIGQTISHWSHHREAWQRGMGFAPPTIQHLPSASPYDNLVSDEIVEFTLPKLCVVTRIGTSDPIWITF